MSGPLAILSRPKLVFYEDVNNIFIFPYNKNTVEGKSSKVPVENKCSRNILSAGIEWTQPPV